MKAFCSLLFLWMLALPAGAQDPGKEVVARLRTVLLFGTNGDLQELAPQVPLADKAHGTRMELLADLNFSSYGLLGTEEQPVWRSYTNWSSPMKGSSEILLSFEPNGQVEDGGMRLDLELWQGKRKVMKTTRLLEINKWLYIAGPQWRGGRLIVGIELLPSAEK
ncbi:hypothetical protein [Roseibacillus ishigakijimensis]|uniref:Uncharacterized protein n=1 Tax=Roseibacillus ishigakijimensis TaxID=454146 RepID=A0A934RTU5_9BACT|nr:hypothetical protein [Roseibacillus ishigakijimensis]MBK1834060.1 hypothetical protein [Roseibacillus ishigakijimensis]